MTTTKMSQDISIVGAGSFGTALACLLAQVGRRVVVLVRREEQAREINEQRTNGRYLSGKTLPDGVHATTSTQEAIEAAPIVLCMVPSKAMRETARRIGDFIRGDHYLVHATKGIEHSTFKRMSEILREETCALKIGVISGPNLAKELVMQQPAGALVASRYDELVNAVQEIFAGSWYRVYGSRDVIGTETAGAFKNIIALASGMASGMGMGDNTKSLLVTRGLNEMATLGVSMGAEVYTFGGLAGIGDLMATCNSELSRNFQVGFRLAQGQKLEDILSSMHYVAEGVPTTQAVYPYAQSKGLDLPIVSAVHGVLFENRAPAAVLQDLMQRPTGPEMAGLRV